MAASFVGSYFLSLFIRDALADHFLECVSRSEAGAAGEGAGEVSGQRAADERLLHPSEGGLEPAEGGERDADGDVAPHT